MEQIVILTNPIAFFRCDRDQIIRRNLIKKHLGGVGKHLPLEGKLQRQGKPTVFMDVLSQNDMPAVPTSRYLRVDDAAIGRAAARHFLSLGNFRSFAFVHDTRDEIWTRERQAAFAATLACYLADGWDIVQAIRYATVAAGLSTTRQGVPNSLVDNESIALFMAQEKNASTEP